jgi:hypothetical protein
MVPSNRISRFLPPLTDRKTSGGWDGVLRKSPHPTAADIYIHAWLNERLAVLHYERHGLWPRTRQFLQAIGRSLLWPSARKDGRLNKFPWER